MNGYFISGAVICAVCVTAWMIKCEKGGKCVMLSALQGVAAIFAVNIIGMVSGVSLSVNWYTLGTGALLGVPGIIGMLMMNAFYN